MPVMEMVGQHCTMQPQRWVDSPANQVSGGILMIFRATSILSDGCAKQEVLLPKSKGSEEWMHGVRVVGHL